MSKQAKPELLLANFQKNFYGRMFGLYSGKVLDNKDPANLFRLKCSCPAFFGDDSSSLEWAVPRMSLVDLPEIGDIVFITFIDGRIDNPAWEYGPFQVDGAPRRNVPKHAKAEPDLEDQGIKGTNGIPKSSFAGEYGKVRIWRSRSGHLVEMDDTPGNERVQIYHQRGSHIEMLADGTICEGALGDKIEAVLQDKRTQVNKDERHNVGKDYFEEIGGNYTQTVYGDVTLDWRGTQTNNFGKHAVNTRGDQEYNAGGSLKLNTTNNEQHQIGGSLSTTVNNTENKVVLGPKETYVTNTLNTNPLANSYYLHSMNGQNTITNTTKDGVAAGGYVNHGTEPLVTKVYSGPTPNPLLQVLGEGRDVGAGILLDGTGIGSVLHSAVNLLVKAKAMITLSTTILQLGGRAAVHPIILGDIFMQGYMAHTHPSAAGPTGTPIDPIAMTSLSKKVFTE